VHFAWVADFYEAGQNSDWLLPNRLYRAALYRAVPIAAANVETGRWLQSRGSGIVLEEPVGASLVEVLRSMSPGGFAHAKSSLDGIPRSDLVTDVNDCKDLVGKLAALALTM
jgi:succinoglycan biosynthesis protein ExoL